MNNNIIDDNNLDEIFKSSDNYFESTIKQKSTKSNKKQQKATKNNKTKQKSTNINKSVLKVKKFDFLVDPDLVDYLDYQIFITGIREKKDYLNHLIREDLKKRLNISDNQDLIDEWLKYKDTHIPKGLK